MSTQPSKLLIAFLTFSAYGNATGCQYPGQKCNGEFQCCSPQQCKWSQDGFRRCQNSCTPNWQACTWNSDCCSNTCLWPSEHAGGGVCRYLSGAMNGGSSTAIGTQGGKQYTYTVHQRRLDSSDELDAPEDSQNADESCEEPDVCFVLQADCCLGSVCVAQSLHDDGYCVTPTVAAALKDVGFVTSADQENGDDRRRL